jgi:hypothetical protein
MDRLSNDTLKGRLLNAGVTGMLGKSQVRIPSAVKDGETFSVGDEVFEMDTDGVVTAGRIEVDLSGGAARAAKGTLTIDDTFNAVANETVVIGTRTYTWKDTLTGANQVLVGTDDEDSCVNLALAINGGAGAGTKYGTGTAVHALVTAAAVGRTVVVTAKTLGTVGNAIASTETMTKGAWDASTLGTTQAGVDPTGAEAVTALVALINGLTRKPFMAKALGANDFVLLTKTPTQMEIPVSETLVGSNNAVEAEISGGFVETLDKVRAFALVPSAVEVAAGFIVLPVSPVPAGCLVQVRVTSSGALKAWDGAVIYDTDMVLLDNSGSTDWAGTDTVSVILF